MDKVEAIMVMARNEKKVFMAATMHRQSPVVKRRADGAAGFAGRRQTLRAFTAP
jgi:hypothetical protein